MAKNIRKKKEPANGSKKGKQTEKNKAKKTATGKKESAEKERLGNDYWDRVADDVAAGYTSEEDENKILNRDEEPGDDEQPKGD